MKPRRQSAFSLLEIMVSMTLLVLIVGGLMVVFNYTTRGLRSISNTTDVFEGARSLVAIVGRDVSETTAAPDFEYTNFFANFFVTNAGVVPVQLPDGTTSYNVLQDMFFLTRNNDDWNGVGYFVDRTAASSAVGTLYRFNAVTNNVPPVLHESWLTNFLGAARPQHVHRMVDGVVHFQVTPYDARGRVYSEFPNVDWIAQAKTNLPPDVIADITNNVCVRVTGEIRFHKSYLPASVDLEIGILEPETVRKFRAIESANAAAAQTYLSNNIGKMHLFRQRIPIRNHSMPPAFD
jgi:type II secretory pathway pseudopilin PulG